MGVDVGHGAERDGGRDEPATTKRIHYRTYERKVRNTSTVGACLMSGFARDSLPHTRRSGNLDRCGHPWLIRLPAPQHSAMPVRHQELRSKAAMSLNK